MLYLFHGTNTTKTSERAHVLVSSLSARQPEALVFALEGGRGDLEKVADLALSRGLFVEKHIVTMKGFTELADERTRLVAYAEQMATSPNVFVIVEGSIDAGTLRGLAAHATKVEEHTQTAVRPAFNVFAVSDALYARDRRQLWVAYVRALRAGHAPEAIHGTLSWATRSMLLAVMSTNAAAAGQKEYTYGKAKQAAQRYSRAELRMRAHELMTLYHEAHRGRYELAIALERWVLRV